MSAGTVKTVIIIITGLILILSIFGCKGKKMEKDEPLCGGVTDKTDLNAPKVIESTDIESYFSCFYLHKYGDPVKCEQLRFSVNKNEDGVLTAKEELTGSVAEADEELLNSLQKIIEKNKLVEKNGIYRTTAGLPPEFDPVTVTVNYKSGESLTFTENNDPTSVWADEITAVFTDWFEKKGVNNLRKYAESNAELK